MPASRFACVAILALASATAHAEDSDAPLPMRTEAPIVYATPIENMVILEFKLYDNVTWCRLYIAKDTWDRARANGNELPSGTDTGHLDCEQR